MGFRYLGEKCWADVTREERFFCQHLFALCLKHGVERVLSCIYKNDYGSGSSRNVEWEPAFEVCFYRDLLHLRNMRDARYSPETNCPRKPRFSLKRTFDFVFFSETAIVILEAKAQQGFDGKQLEGLKCDRKLVKDLTKVENVWVYGLASSQYKPRTSTIEWFDAPLLTWSCLANAYDGDEILERADALYNDKKHHR